MFNVTDFFRELIANTNLQGIVWLYNGSPAIREAFKEMPDVSFIQLCADDPVYQYCPWSDTILSGYVDFTIKIFEEKWWASREGLRAKVDIIRQELRRFSALCITSIRIDASSWPLIEPQSERLYTVMSARAYFR